MDGPQGASSTLSLPMSQGKPSLRRIKGRIHRSKSLDSMDLLDSWSGKVLSVTQRRLRVSQWLSALTDSSYPSSSREETEGEKGQRLYFSCGTGVRVPAHCERLMSEESLGR
ncbi:unnamed protein product [Arctogadus glacialis]